MALAGEEEARVELEAAEVAPGAVIIAVVAPVTMVPEVREAIGEMTTLAAPPASVTEATLAKGAVLALGAAMIRGIRAGMEERGVAVQRKQGLSRNLSRSLSLHWDLQACVSYAAAEKVRTPRSA